MDDIHAQRPALTIDLVAPEGNVYALVAKARMTLEQAGQVEQSKALGNWFVALPPQGSGVTYDDVRRMVEQYWCAQVKGRSTSGWKSRPGKPPEEPGSQPPAFAEM